MDFYRCIIKFFKKLNLIRHFSLSPGKYLAPCWGTRSEAIMADVMGDVVSYVE